MTDPATAVPTEATTRRPPTAARIVTVGLASGLLSGVFGVGGGLLIVPGLVLLLGFTQRAAHGTSLGAIVPIAVSGVLTYWAEGNVDWPAAAALAVGAMGGAVLGTKLLQVLPHRILAIAFVGVLVVTAIRLFVPTEAAGRGALGVGAALALMAVGLLSGVLAGLLGVGGGIVMVPAMVVLFGIPSAVAKGTSVAVIIPTSVVGTLRNRRADNVDLRVAALIGVCGSVTAIPGALIAGRLGDTTSNVLFALLLSVVAIKQLSELRRSPVR